MSAPNPRLFGPSTDHTLRRRLRVRLAILCFVLAAAGLALVACAGDSKRSAPSFVQDGHAPPPPLPPDAAPPVRPLRPENAPPADAPESVGA